MNPATALIAIVLAAIPFAQATELNNRQDVIGVFSAYESLNADFVRSASTGTGKTGRTYSELRREAETYAEGPLAQALLKAQVLLCRSSDQELLASLLRVTIATSNSASEAPTEVLVQVAKCQPAQLKAIASNLSVKERKQLARRAPELAAIFK